MLIYWYTDGDIESDADSDTTTESDGDSLRALDMMIV